jgi:hypothetical protein
MALHHLLSPYEEPGSITVWGCLSHKNDARFPAVCMSDPEKALLGTSCGRIGVAMLHFRRTDNARFSLITFPVRYNRHNKERTML